MSLSGLLRPLDPMRRLTRARQVEDRDPAARARLVRSALAAADLCFRLPVFARLFWRSALTVYHATFQLEKAERVLALASRRGYAGAAEAAAASAALIACLAGWSDAVAEARDALLTPDAPPAGRPVVFLPSIAFGLRQDNWALNGARGIFLDALDHFARAGQPVSVRIRLGTHGTPRVPAGTPYVAHHTIDPSGQGLHIKATDRPGCFSVDRRGYSGWSDFAHTPLDQAIAGHPLDDMVERAFAQDRLRLIAGNVSKYRQDETASVDVGEPFLFVALQTIHDVVQQLAHVPMLTMLDEVARHARTLGIPVIVKRHPLCGSTAVDAALKAGIAEGLFQLSTASIHRLIERSLAVCTVNSSVGAEALIHGKPVYLFGAAEYQQVCFRVTAPGAFATMFRPGAHPVDAGVLQRFLYALRHDYAIDTADPAHAAALSRRLAALASPPDEAGAGGETRQTAFDAL